MKKGRQLRLALDIEVERFHFRLNIHPVFVFVGTPFAILTITAIRTLLLGL